MMGPTLQLSTEDRRLLVRLADALEQLAAALNRATDLAHERDQEPSS